VISSEVANMNSGCQQFKINALQ